MGVYFWSLSDFLLIIVLVWHFLPSALAFFYSAANKHKERESSAVYARRIDQLWLLVSHCTDTHIYVFSLALVFNDLLLIIKSESSAGVLVKHNHSKIIYSPPVFLHCVFASLIMWTLWLKSVGPITGSTTWTNTVRNRFRQKAGEIETFRALEIGAAKWCKEHIPHKGNDLTDEGLLLLDGMELWWEKQNLLWACHNSRKTDRMNIDGTFLPHQKGAISATFTSDWYLRKGETETSWGSG